MPTESSTPTVYNDLIREFLITRPDGTQVKVQAIAEVDAVNPYNVAAIDLQGNRFVRIDSMEGVFRALLREMRQIRWAIESMAGVNSDDNDFDLEEAM